MTKKSGIYPYILTKEEKHLSIRPFADNMKREACERQEGICTKCKEFFSLENMEADHIIPWHEGGKTTTENCQILCKDCNRKQLGKLGMWWVANSSSVSVNLPFVSHHLGAGILVLRRGLEPPWDCSHTPLKRARLPVPPPELYR